MTTTATGQIVNVPNRIWYVHVNNSYDSMWGSRALARSRKSTLASYGVSGVTLSSSTVTLGCARRDLHS